MSDIHTTFDETTDPDDLDNGVVKEVVAEEEYVREGERIEKETTLAILEDGGVHINQRVTNLDGMWDSLTLSEAVADRLLEEREGDG